MDWKDISQLPIKELLEHLKIEPDFPRKGFYNAAGLFKVLGDPTRIHIILVLSENPELCVQDLSESIKLNGSAISHHLRTLRLKKLVKQRRIGKNVFYSLKDHYVIEILKLAIIHNYK